MTIFLDEQALGRDQRRVVLRSIILCGGVLGKTENGWVIGAHFDPGASATCIAAGLNHIRTNWMLGTRLNRAFFFYLKSEWATRGDNLASSVGLKDHIKAGLGMDNRSELQLYDKGALSKLGGIDFMADNHGGSLWLSYRKNPGGQNTDAQTLNVRYVKFNQPHNISKGSGHWRSPHAGGWHSLAQWQD